MCKDRYVLICMSFSLWKVARACKVSNEEERCHEGMDKVCFELKAVESEVNAAWYRNLKGESIAMMKKEAYEHRVQGSEYPELKELSWD